MKYFLSLTFLLSLSACSFLWKPSEIPDNTGNPQAILENTWTTIPTISGAIQQKEDVKKIPPTPHDAKVLSKSKAEEPVTKTATGVADDKEVEAIMKDIDAIFADIANEKK